MNIFLFYSLSRVTQKQLVKTFLLCILTFPLSAETLKLSRVRYLLPESAGFSEPSDIIIEGNKIVDIVPAAKKGDVRFVTSTFCDAYVTLGADSMGGVSDKGDVNLALRSFIVHGFTSLQSVGDGYWIHDYAVKKQKERPDIFIAGKPMIPDGDETTLLNPDIFYPIHNEKEGLAAIQNELKSDRINLFLFHRFRGQKDYPFNAALLYKMNGLAAANKKKLIASTYGDRYSILESLAAGIRLIHHPIPLTIGENFHSSYSTEIKWMPMIAVYFFQSRTKEEIMKETDFMNLSSFFKDHYSSRIALLQNGEKEIERAKEEYLSYQAFLRKYPELTNNMILAGGSGYNFQFPGMAGINEMKQLFLAGIEGEKILRIASENTCSFIGAGAGKIRKGESANLLVFGKNPASSPEHLLAIESVIKNGLLIYSVTPVNSVPEKKKGRKNVRKKTKK